VTLYAIQVVLILVTGLGLNRLLPGRSRGLIMEVFPLRVPVARVVLRTTWEQFKEFLVMAVPVVLIGSLVLGGLYETGYLWLLTAPLAPAVEGWLGLPAVAGLTLVVATLRKELALQLLVTLAVARFGHGANNLLQFMAPSQIFVYTLVNTIYIPCAATFGVLGKEVGWWRTVAITGFTIVLALAVGGLARWLIDALHLFGA
jgi:ferrous iron transport protein B